MSKEGGITTGRAKRVMKVGALTTSVGGSYLWQTLKRPFQTKDRTKQALLDAHIRNAMKIVNRSKELKGAFLKLIQMLSMRADLFPSEAIEVLSAVQSSMPPMNYKLIRQQISRELGSDPESLFKSFEPQAFAAASLGQVHKAVLKDGRPVVVKVQYPGVEETVDQDLKNLRALLHALSLIGRDLLRQKVDAAELYRELEERLHEEIDYINEANNIALFQKLLADDEEVEVPDVYPDYSSRRVLTMGYLDGYSFKEIMAPGVDQELKDWIAVKLYRLVWRQIFDFGILHTDPHPGNYLVTYHPHLCLLDYGSIRVFPEEIRRQYVKLAYAILHRDRQVMADCFLKLGYLDPDDDPGPMARIMEIIFEPILEDRVYNPRDFRSLDKALEVASIGFENRIFKIPGHRVFLVRALVGLEAYLQQFGTTRNWHRLFVECLPPLQDL